MFTSIETSAYTSVISVKSIHESILEFVLKNTAERNKKGDEYHYIDFLIDEVRKALSPLKGAWYEEDQTYGNVQFSIGAYTLPELQEAISISARIVDTWLNKYNINKMKR